MKILWIVNTILPKFIPFVSGNYRTGGSWITPLFYALEKYTDIQLGIITPIVNGRNQKEIIDQISYYSISIRKDDNFRNKIREVVVKNYRWAINDFKPDLVHVHGTERNFGLLRKYLPDSIPIACSIQGLIVPYFDYLNLSFPEANSLKFKSLKNILYGGGLSGMKKRWKKYRAVEKEIIEINKYFIGRTEWDKAHIQMSNPNAKYFFGDELLRDEFHDYSWDLDTCEKHSIFLSSGGGPIKGLHILLLAANIIKNKYPKLKIYVPLLELPKSHIKKNLLSNEYSVYIYELLESLNLKSHIKGLYRLSSNEMASRFASSHVFVLPSFIDNSPNALAEAMKIGVPSIVSYTGGVSSMINENSSLVFPIGDYKLLAYYIDQIFQSDELAKKLSNESKKIADFKQNRIKVAESYYKTYSEIIEINKQDRIAKTF